MPRNIMPMMGVIWIQEPQLPVCAHGGQDSGMSGIYSDSVRTHGWQSISSKGGNRRSTELERREVSPIMGVLRRIRDKTGSEPTKAKRMTHGRG